MGPQETNMEKRKKFWHFILGHRRYLILPADIFLSCLSFYLAGTLRFDSFQPLDWSGFVAYPDFYRILAVYTGTRACIFILMGLYRSLWAYASLHDLYLIMKTSLAATLAGIIALLFYNHLEGMSRSVLILDGILLFLLLSFRSFSWRIFRDLFILRQARNGKRTLVIGAGLTANRLVQELRANQSHQILPVGFLDDDVSKIGAHIQGIPVLGRIDGLDEQIAVERIEEVIVTIKLPGNIMRKIYRSCEEKGIQCKTIPPLREILNRQDLGNALRDISLEDLLGRDIVRLETESIQKIIQGKTVLITGAGGSIGSEVCRQVLTYDPAVMILFDSAETPLYEIDYELRNSPQFLKNRNSRLVSIIGDVKSRETLSHIFKQHEIQIVFHCAAYKHVPMMELNPGEAVMNNVIGTCNVANASRDAGVDRFVMISTDKAVNPVNIMGATKRIAELYIQNLARTSDTKYITVRFGNVLGSNGSVIPLFKKQIEAGGPVTVTHPEIIRYFMTIQEAAGLVIQAGAMGREGEIFILDMGEPVRIKDLAEDMIRFAGLVPHKDVEIRYIGLRPGEKLFEELLLAGEGIQPTRHNKIHIAMSHNLNIATLNAQIEGLENAARNDSRMDIDSIIGSILPEYRPIYSVRSKLDRTEEENLNRVIQQP